MIATADQPRSITVPTDKTVVLFDGACNFCNHSVNFLIDHDPADQFRFASQQSGVGQQIMRDHGLSDLLLNTMIVLDHGKVFTHSSAALRLAKSMPLPWRLLSGFVIVPPFLRNWAYRLFAKNRYRLFGHVEACRMPTPAIRAKFL